MDALEQAQDWIAQARRVVALTGAGVSAESGIPTFRGPGGLWRDHRPEDLATPEAFARDPRLVWEWYDWRRGLVAAAKPNAAHEALARFERLKPLVLVSQNVDGLHQQAGSRDVLLLHGDLWTVRCTSCGVERGDRIVPLPELPPRCGCGGLLRPGVVWFGEPLPAGVMERALGALEEADLLLVVGTSAVVWPAAGLIPAALESRRRVIEVNPVPTEYSGRALAIPGKAAEVLPVLLG